MSQQNQQQKVRRLFVDPASYKTGWALFEDKECIEHGPIWSHKKDPYDRFRDIYFDYLELCERVTPDECFVENFKVYSTKKGGLVIGSHYVIGTALRFYAPVAKIWTQHWQAFAGYKKGEEMAGPLAEWVQPVHEQHGLEGKNAEDVLAAIGMGLWYTGRDR